jgi:AmmeMemoRadiSam system protein A
MANDFALIKLDKSIQKQILDWCWEILKCTFKRTPIPEGPSIPGKGGVFVTLKRGGKLRGCVGIFSWDNPLKQTILDMTQAAAFHDNRFPPLSEKELEGLDITVSVLTPPAPLKSLDDLKIGRDGLFLIHPHGRGVLLPVVAEEYGFTPRQFAEQTSVKAGLNPRAYQDPGAELLVFTAPAFSSSDFS